MLLTFYASSNGSQHQWHLWGDPMSPTFPRKAMTSPSERILLMIGLLEGGHLVLPHSSAPGIWSRGYTCGVK